MKNKNPRKPTREQKKKIEEAGYRRDNWLVAHEDNISMTIVHKQTATKKVILC